MVGTTFIAFSPISLYTILTFLPKFLKNKRNFKKTAFSLVDRCIRRFRNSDEGLLWGNWVYDIVLRNWAIILPLPKQNLHWPSVAVPKAKRNSFQNPLTLSNVLSQRLPYCLWTSSCYFWYIWLITCTINVRSNVRNKPIPFNNEE